MIANPATTPSTCDLIEEDPALLAGVTALAAAVGATTARGVEFEATVTMAEAEEIEGVELGMDVDDVELLLVEGERAAEVPLATVVTTFPAL